jgi:hypothetical protein
MDGLADPCWQKLMAYAQRVEIDRPNLGSALGLNHIYPALT